MYAMYGYCNIWLHDFEIVATQTLFSCESNGQYSEAIEKPMPCYMSEVTNSVSASIIDNCE